MYDVKRAVIYTRVSTDAQAEDDKASLSEQERMCRAYIDSKGWDYVRTYEDGGYSGRTTDRPSLQEMLSDIRERKFDAVVVYKLDRLSRKQKDTLMIIEDYMNTNGVTLASLHESLDTSTPIGMCIIGVLSSFAQMESDNIVMRTSMGRNAKAKQGGYAGGKPPLGYKAVDGALVVVPEEAEIVRLVYHLRENGGTLIGIAEELNRRGYRTKGGKEFKHSAVQVILNNRDTYLGHYKYGENGSENSHEPILKARDGE